MNLRTPQFIYFDLGNVLLKFDNQVACRQMGHVAGVPPEQVRKVLFEEGLEERYERGELSSRAFYDEFCQRTGTRPDFHALLEAGSAMFTMNAFCVAVAVQLAMARYRLGLLSNTCEAHWQYVSGGRYSVIPCLFSLCVLSYEVRALKPAPEIYQVATELAGVSASHIFYVDDREEHVAGALRAGWDAVVYRSADQLCLELRRRGVQFNF